jgi:hypothetical protein
MMPTDMPSSSTTTPLQAPALHVAQHLDRARRRAPASAGE